MRQSEHKMASVWSEVIPERQQASQFVCFVGSESLLSAY